MKQEITFELHGEHKKIMLENLEFENGYAIFEVDLDLSFRAEFSYYKELCKVKGVVDEKGNIIVEPREDYEEIVIRHNDTVLTSVLPNDKKHLPCEKKYHVYKIRHNLLMKREIDLHEYESLKHTSEKIKKYNKGVKH